MKYIITLNGNTYEVKNTSLRKEYKKWYGGKYEWARLTRLNHLQVIM